MTRKKVKLQYITDDSARKASFKKRKKGLVKKVSELSTLCGVDACAIIYSAYDPQPEVWPSPIGARNVLARFRETSEMEQRRKMVNQESYLRQRVTKSREKLEKEKKETRDMEITEYIHQALAGKNLSLRLMDLKDIGSMADRILKEITKRLESLEKAECGSQGKGIASASEVVSSSRVKTTAAVNQQVNVNTNMQRQERVMDMLNPLGQMGYSGNEQMMLQFADHNRAAIATAPATLPSHAAFFPWGHQG